MSRQANAAPLFKESPKAPPIRLPLGDVQWIGFVREADGKITTHVMTTRNGVPVAAIQDTHVSLGGAAVDAKVAVIKMLASTANPLARR